MNLAFEYINRAQTLELVLQKRLLGGIKKDTRCPELAATWKPKNGCCEILDLWIHDLDNQAIILLYSCTDMFARRL